MSYTAEIEFIKEHAEMFSVNHQGRMSVGDVAILLRRYKERALREGASPIEASSPEPSSARTTAESGTGVIAGDAQEQPTEGNHPSSVKGIGEEGWISVEERLPEHGTKCLVAPANRVMSYGPYEWFGEPMAPNFYEWDDDTDVSYEGVTHWMPLPSPPDQPH